MKKLKIYKFLFFIILLFGYCDKLFSMSKVDSYYSLALQKVKSFIRDNRYFLMRDNAKELKIIVGGTAVSCITIYLFMVWLKERNKNKDLSEKYKTLSEAFRLSNQYIDSINKAAGITEGQFNECAKKNHWNLYFRYNLPPDSGNSTKQK